MPTHVQFKVAQIKKILPKLDVPECSSNRKPVKLPWPLSVNMSTFITSNTEHSDRGIPAWGPGSTPEGVRV